MSCLADSWLPPCWLLLYAAAALLGDGDGGDLSLASCTHNHKDKVLGHTPQNMLIALLHCCLGDPWAGVGLVLILKTAKHLC
ncbi:hypothetical protein V8C86DRAFT_2922934, partial [Haematococcus lacustris]